jgi:hypothetical protein
MDIIVNRVSSQDGKIIFTIEVSSPDAPPFTEDDYKVFEEADAFLKTIESLHPSSKCKYTWDLQSASHQIKSERYDSVKNRLKSNIRYVLEPKFDHILQEIYNWNHDHQPDHLKRWMSECDPLRSTFYFDNDERGHKEQQPECYDD